ncbi:unnamed protein product [Lactuca virosa]|uniref:Biotin carboxylation domain-containing protein n=1 Tax=Lactuca virosa TaxID=75947 RepID=A0AAU9M782_9ASTR|nr:unnamed protein product [Lactuca virosa]
MGIPCVSVYSTIDKDALHVKLADESFCIGHLLIPNVLSVAISHGCTMLHPGYGFLAENAVFVEMCREHGINFIDPNLKSGVWVVVTYYLVGFDHQFSRCLKQFGLYFSLHQMSIGLFRMMGALGRNMIVANTFRSFSMLVVMALGGFILFRAAGVRRMTDADSVAMPEGSSLYDLVQTVITTTHASVGVVLLLREEWSLVKDIPVLFAIDQDIEYLKLYSSRYGREEGVEILEKIGMYLGPHRYTLDHAPIDMMRDKQKEREREHFSQFIIEGFTSYCKRKRRDNINYVSAHDNETLFDIISLKAAMKISNDERWRINHLATSVIALSQMGMWDALLKANLQAIPTSIPIIALSFVYQNVVPVLSTNLKGDLSKISVFIPNPTFFGWRKGSQELSEQGFISLKQL